MIREQHIVSGKLLEVKYYPVFSDGKPMPRSPKQKLSSKAQLLYNNNLAVKKIIRTVNANFDNTDLFVHPTYSTGYSPLDEAEARKDFNNYIRRLKTHIKNKKARIKKQLKERPDDEQLKKDYKKLCQEFKYYYALQTTIYKTGPLRGTMRFHFHVFMTGFGTGDRDEAEEIWMKGENKRINADRFRPDKFGPIAAARYIGKGAEGFRRFAGSKNLSKPVEEKPIDGETTPLEVERMVKRRSDDKQYWKNKFRGYTFMGFEKPPENCYNEYNGFYYLTVLMYKKDRKERKPTKKKKVG